jgi:hypothetical protein
MSAIRTPSISASSHAGLDDRVVQLAWFVGGAIYAFLVPYVFWDRLGIQHDWYYAIYFGAVALLVGAYAVSTRADLAGAFRRNWVLSLALGIPAAAFVAWNVLREDATPHPEGAYFGFELLWRGVVYGAVDALLLTAFPALVAYGLLRGNVTGVARRAGFAALALALTLVITATYHWGYGQYRANGMAQNGLGGPLFGNTVMSVPAFASTNPLGTVIAHVTMHVTATNHAYETDVFLPPKTDSQ